MINRIRLFVALTATVLLSGACASPATTDSQRKGAANNARGPAALAVDSRIIGKRVDFVEVRARWRGEAWRLTDAALISPNGQAVAPESEKRHSDSRPAPAALAPSGFVGIGGWPYGRFGSSVGLGLGIGFPLALFSPQRPRSYRHYRATFRVNDVPGFRNSRAEWRVRLRFVDRTGREYLKTMSPPGPGQR